MNCEHNYGDCLEAICTASDSNKITAKCWCSECKTLRKEMRANIRKSWNDAFDTISRFAQEMGA